MRLIKMVDISLNDCKQIKDKDVVALVAIILNQNDHCISVEDLLDYGFEKKQVNELFKRIKDYFILKKTKNGYLLTKQQISDETIAMVANVWGINQLDVKLALETTTPHQYLAKLLYPMRFNLPQTNLNKPDDADVTNLEIYYQRIYLGDLINKYELGISQKDLMVINMWLLKTKIPPAVFKFVFEQSIVQNQHKNFIAVFFEKIVASYNKHKIATIEQAIAFNHQRNTNISQSSNNYVKPVYTNDDNEILSEEEIIQLKGKIYEGN